MKPHKAGRGARGSDVPDVWGRLLRITAMAHELLAEMHAIPLDEGGLARVRKVYTSTVSEIVAVLPDELRKELEAVAPPLSEQASESEVRLAQVQIVGWLEGLMHGMNAAVWAEVVRRLTHPVPDGKKEEEAADPGQYL